GGPVDRELGHREGSVAAAVPDFSGDASPPPEGNPHVRPVDRAELCGPDRVRRSGLRSFRAEGFFVSGGVVLLFGRAASAGSTLDSGALPDCAAARDVQLLRSL